MKERINWIDWAKVIAIIAVVIGHTKFKQEDIFLKYFIYNFHMPFFFILSGYLFKVKGTFLQFLKKSVRTLLIPYVLLNLIAFILSFIIPYNKYPLSQQLHDFCVGIGVGMPAGPTWFLVALFNVRILTYFTLQFEKLLQLVLIISYMIIAYILFHFTSIGTDYTLTISLVATSFFIGGYYLKTIIDRNNIKLKFQLLATISAILLFIVVTYKIQFGADLFSFNWGIHPELYAPVALLGSFIIISVSFYLNNKGYKIIQVLSSGTIIILAFHHIITNTVIPYLSLKLIGHFDNNIFTNIIASIITVLIFYYPILWTNSNKYLSIALLGGRKYPK